MVNHLQANLVQMLKVATVTFVTFQQAKGPAIDNFEGNLGPLGLLGPLGPFGSFVPFRSVVWGLGKNSNI